MGKRRLIVLLASALVATVLPLALAGFTVDDAFIPARYAQHLAHGLGYRFNKDGLISDGVTPLPWAMLLVPFARSTMSAFVAAKWLGFGAWVLAAAALGDRIDELAGRRLGAAHGAMLLVAACPAVAGWSVAGLETGVVMALSTAAVLCRRRLAPGAALAGLAAAFRPEMTPWAVVVAAAMGWQRQGGNKTAAVLVHAALGLAPFVLVALIRAAVFGDPAPLSVRAKPSDLTHGGAYVLAGLLLTGLPLAVLAPVGIARLRSCPQLLLVALGVHSVALVAAGGDWMPLSRLFAPVLPSLALVFAELATHTRWWSNALRFGLAAAAHATVLMQVGADAARVQPQRLALVQMLAPHVRDEDVLASIDVGWIGASTNGTVVDLAGVTDRAIASLPGGHTSKNVSALTLAERRVSLLLLLIPAHQRGEDAWNDRVFARAAETRLARDPWVAENFEPVGELRASDRLAYLLVRRRTDRL